ncbi:MAG: patatin-like phospholipase family protein, partial [Sphaerochaeta sp.]|nr:patatin-like phospholipase family protein [Sphaerochaeta sp.]
MKTFKKLLIMALLICMALSSLAAADEADDILLSDVPISYGDEMFRERILARTQGERSPVGLVLSGGSARAFAHIGVLKYLEEQDIVPDFIISNSMGSIVGLLYAAGLSPDQILESVTSVNLQSMFDLTLPVSGGMLDSSRFLAKVASIVGSDLQLETLPIPIIVVTEDLVTKRQVTISEGDFFTVLQASYALPVYFPPVEYRGHLLIDGGITNLAPVDLAY